LEHLMKIYYESIGRGANLILNIPPNKEGLIHPIDSARLVEFGQALKREFSRPLKRGAIQSFTASNIRGDSKTYNPRRVVDGKRTTYWATDDNVRKAALTLTLKKPEKLYSLRLREPIQLGQRIGKFQVEAQTTAGEWKMIATGTTIGPQHLSKLDGVEATAVRITVESTKACPLLSEVQLYLPPLD